MAHFTEEETELHRCEVTCLRSGRSWDLNSTVLPQEGILQAPLCTGETSPGGTTTLQFHEGIVSQTWPGGPLTPVRSLPALGILLVPMSPTKCLQASKEPIHFQQLVKNIIFLSINLEADSKSLGSGDWRTIFSEETILPRIKGTCL